MNEDGAPAWSEVYRCRELVRCQEFALVLAALGMDYWVAQDEDTYRLLVPADIAPGALTELREYEAETQTPPPAPQPPAARTPLLHLPLYWGLLLAFNTLQKFAAFSLDWLAAGRAHARLILQGEWWRTFTALTLHADGPHLFNNLLFGSFFGLLLARELGAGLAWCAVLLAGALGNGLNAWLHHPEHTSIGASTGIFGAAGLLFALQWRNRDPARPRWLQRWAPPAIGAVLLGFLGTSGERTDVLAHVTGMGAGALLGLPLCFARRPLRAGAWLQVLGAAATLLLLALAWLRALDLLRFA